MVRTYLNICDELILELQFDSIRLYERCCLDFRGVQENPTIGSTKKIIVKYLCENMFMSYSPVKNIGPNMFYFLDSSGSYIGIAENEEVLVKQYAWLIFYIITEQLDKKKYYAVHASAICNAKGALLIAGEKGSGKSSLANHMIMNYNYRFLGDDFCLIDISKQKIISVASTIALQIAKERKTKLNYECEESAQLKHCFFPVLAPLVSTPHIQMLPSDYLLQALVNNRWGGMSELSNSLLQIVDSLKGYLLTLGFNIDQNSMLLDRLHNVEE